jgi:hypothetical protein
MAGSAQAWHDGSRSGCRITSFSTALALLLACVPSAGLGATLFEDDTVLTVRLSGPLDSLLEDPESRDELPFVLSANGVDHDIMVRLRGRSRRELCQFPPLRFKFAEEDTANTVFAGQRKLKLVTHCRPGDSYKTSALREYAAYRIFNLLSEVSYRVRLLRITYEDTDGRLKETTFERYGFLIEPATSLAARTDGRIAEVCGISIASLDNLQAASAFIFNFLIGNTDWSLVPSENESCCCHNIDLIDVGARRYTVPFDFDLSGLVNARYARPNPVTRISRVTQRRYRGYCLPPGSLAPALRQIKERKTEVLNVVRYLPGLSPKERRTSLEFLERFFDRAEDEDKLLRSFERRCLR